MAGPWGPLSAQTRGLLSLLGIKNTGRNPGQLLDDVRPVVEVVPWYLQGGALNGQNTIAIAAPMIGQSSNLFVVPEGQVWYVHSFGIRAEVGFGPAVLAAAYGIAPVVRYNNPATLFVGESITWVDNPVAINPTPQIAPPSLRDFWAPGGTFLCGYANSLDIQNAGGTDIYLTGFVRYTPMVV